MTKIKFRRDINGLRGIAVIGVLLFHFGVSGFSGGFVGVDVFFVISGFLMTAIIVGGLEQRNFPVLHFYIARANRIVPALALLLLLVLILGWFLLSPFRYVAVAREVLASIGFLSNYEYSQHFKAKGYFATLKFSQFWLLHSWSLSVEMQFYLLYPLALVAMRRCMSLHKMKIMILLLTLAGFIFCIYTTYQYSPAHVYYSLPTRAWQMLLGGVAYLYPHCLKGVKPNLLLWLGFTLIIGSYLFLPLPRYWPNYMALFPVLGTFLILQAQDNNNFMLHNKFIQHLGTWSYSIYLYHYPLVVAMNYYSLNHLIYPLMGLSVLFGFLSYQYIEKLGVGQKKVLGGGDITGFNQTCSYGYKHWRFSYSSHFNKPIFITNKPS